MTKNRGGNDGSEKMNRRTIAANSKISTYSRQGLTYLESDPNSASNLFFLAGSTSVLCPIKPCRLPTDKKGRIEEKEHFIKSCAF